jgi:predicted protein tyrosine phosphatase
LTQNKNQDIQLPPEWRKEMKEIFSSATEETIDLVSNIVGVYIDKKQRLKMKRHLENEMTSKFEEVIVKGIQIGKEMVSQDKTDKLSAHQFKEQFYRLTDNMRSLFEDIPEDVHVMDALFRALEVLKEFRFEFSYLKNTKYSDYIQAVEELLKQIDRESKIEFAGNFLFNFKDTNDAYALLQATFQKIPDYYKFLEQELKEIKKKDVDRYLEIYDELSGHFEKTVALLAGLGSILLTNSIPNYDNLKKRRLYANLLILKKQGYEKTTSGFNRHIRNAIVHRTFKVDLVNENVTFYDVNIEFKNSFLELQKSTRELSANLLVLPHIIISTFYTSFLQLKNLLDKIPD